MKLWPESLSGRLIIILLAGLIVAQAVSLIIHFKERGQTIHRLGGLQFSEKIVHTVRQMDSLNQQQRQQFAQANSTSRFQIRFLEQPEPLPKSWNKYHRLSKGIQRMIRHELSDQYPVQVLVSNKPNPAITKLDTNTDFSDHRRLFFAVRVGLKDSSAVDFNFHLPKHWLSAPRNILLPLLVLLTFVVILVLFAVRQTTRPLSMLANAADKLGDDINHPPLKERGPKEVKLAAHAFNQMQQKIQSYLQERTNLLAAVSHDLKTPITRLRIRTEMLEDEALRKKFESDLFDMESMVNETLDYVRGLDQQKDRSDVDLQALIESLQHDLDTEGGKITCELEEIKPYLGHLLSLKRCLTNLIENALKYGEKVHIRLFESADRVLIELTDQGSGIPEELQERVLEPFFRVEGSRSRQTGGSGMGLAIANNIVRSHGGQMTLHNHSDGGLVVRLALPR